MNKGAQAKSSTPGKSSPHKHPCWPVAVNVPAPGQAQTVLHPRKDVFVLKVAKIGAQGDRRSKLELELVTPKGAERKPVSRVDTRETQCEPDPPPCCCGSNKSRKTN